MSVVIKPKRARIALDKRQNVPFVVESTCPKCGAKHIDDLSTGAGKHGGYLAGYTVIGERSPLHCVCDKCEHEWTIHVIVNVLLVVSP